MNVITIYDPMFRVPFATGVFFAMVLPLLGMYLRLREEWLAPLAFAQIGAAGALAATIFGLPALLGSFVAAGTAASAKSWLSRSGNNAYALLMVAGWGAAILMLSNAPLADLGHALFDGQLYYASEEQLWSIAFWSLIALAVLGWISRSLLLERMFPDFFRAIGRSARQYHVLFDLLVAVTIALATTSMGVMAAFSFVFAPSMIAWQWSQSWKMALVVSTSVGMATYVIAFQLALMFDQPFGPVLVLSFVASSLMSGIMLQLLPHVTSPRSSRIRKGSAVPSPPVGEGAEGAARGG
jgi:zinc transport system permease protein